MGLSIPAISFRAELPFRLFAQVLIRYFPGTIPGGTLYIFGWGCAAGTLKPLLYTRPYSADFATLY